MSYLIDGNNLIGHIAPHRMHDPWMRRDLLASLTIFQFVRKTRVSIVFDGPPDTENLGTGPEKPVLVFYPPPEFNADFLIKNKIEGQSDRRLLHVVSSDRDLKAFARSKGAKILSGPDFIKKLKIALKSYERRMEMLKPERPATKLEIEQWKNVFGKH